MREQSHLEAQRQRRDEHLDVTWIQLTICFLHILAKNWAAPVGERPNESSSNVHSEY